MSRRMPADGSTIDHAERVQAKFFVQGEGPEPASLIPVFHAWIRDARVDDPTLVDVADYTHVHHGPGVVLVGHGADWYYDLGSGRPGVMYSRKRAFEGGLQARVADALRRAAAACVELAKDTDATFDAGEVLIRVPDRMHAKNDDQNFKAFAPILEAACREVFGADAVLTVEHPPVEGAVAQNGPLTAVVRVQDGPSLTALSA